MKHNHKNHIQIEIDGVLCRAILFFSRFSYCKLNSARFNYPTAWIWCTLNWRRHWVIWLWFTHSGSKQESLISGFIVEKQAGKGFMTGNAPVADSMPVTDNRPVCCGSFLPDKCCVQLKEAVDFTHMRKRRLISTLYGLSGFGFTKTRRWDPFLSLFLIDFSAHFLNREQKQDKAVDTQQTGHYRVVPPLTQRVYLPSCMFVCVSFLYCSLWFLRKSSEQLWNCARMCPGPHWKDGV